jgi:hypothetical protein
MRERSIWYRIAVHGITRPEFEAATKLALNSPPRRADRVLNLDIDWSDCPLV